MVADCSDIDGINWLLFEPGNSDPTIPILVYMHDSAGLECAVPGHRGQLDDGGRTV